MTRRRKTKRKSKKGPSLWQRLRDRWSGWRPRLGPVQGEVIGLVLLVVAILTLLGLLGVSSGSILGWWATALSRLFGWGAYAMAFGLGLAGTWLMVREFRELVPIEPLTLIGLELLLLVALAALHLPPVLGSGADEALMAAQEGEAGGLVGWALAVLLVEGLGGPVGAFALFAGLLLALFLVLPLTWADIRDWSRYQSRRAMAAFSRWQMARQGALVSPEPQEPPWWEQEPDPAERKAQKKGKAKGRRRRRSKPIPRDGNLPSLDLLDPASPRAYGDTDVRRKTQVIEETLDSFGVPARVVEVNQGPTITQFGLDPGYIERKVSGGEVQRQRVRVGRIASLADDLALALAASPIRIEAPVPGRSVVGLEVPNESVSLVSLRSVVESQEFKRLGSRLAIALGEDVSGNSVSVDLGEMPHLLIAGATGSGKSVCINALVCSLLFHNTPDDLRLLMIDPKMVELTNYNGIPHLLAPVVVEVDQVVGALAWVTRQMDERYKRFSQVGVRNLPEYNRRMSRRKNEDPLPTLVVFIDELADLMMVAPDEVERHLCRVAQMGRATGIHLVVATQRPSVDVVTGLIKANFPARISFAVTSQIDSRVILDQGGAEHLLGRGDMLFMSPQQAAPVRLQGCFVSDREIERMTMAWRGKEPKEEQAPLFPPLTQSDVESQIDDKLQEAITVARGRDRISTSFIQRQLRIGFPRAARLMDQMEELGLVGSDEGGGRGREVLMDQALDLDAIEERLPGVGPG
jgi:S-DNA-T family DNA segregation ATPase FtsK/SpoIIIE